MRQSHTPGPWIVNSDHVMEASGRYIVAEVNYGLPEHEANARLIAASPKLLAACRKARTFAQGSHLADLFSDLDTAISEAEGIE